MKKYIKDFLKNEDGMEIIEFVVILAILVGLIAIISSVGLTVREKATNVKTQITNGLNSITYK